MWVIVGCENCIERSGVKATNPCCSFLCCPWRLLSPINRNKNFNCAECGRWRKRSRFRRHSRTADRQSVTMSRRRTRSVSRDPGRRDEIFPVVTAYGEYVNKMSSRRIAQCIVLELVAKTTPCCSHSLATVSS